MAEPAVPMQERRVDLAVAAATAVLAISTAWLQAVRDGDPTPSAGALMLLLGGAAATVWRRHHPTAVWAVTLVLGVAYGLADWPDPVVPFSGLVALAAVFEFGDRRSRLPIWLASAAAGVAATVWVADSDVLDWWSAVFVLVAGPLAGAYLATRRDLVDELQDRARRLAEEREHEADAARLAERARIARELHDVVAHQVTMLVIQAEAAAGAVSMSDAARRDAMDELADRGREALGELRQLLTVLRSDDPPPTMPQPGLAQLDELVDGVRAAGVPVAVEQRGDLSALPAAIDLAGYRVVQEALTNVVKHAPQAPTELSVAVVGRQLEVEVVNQPSPTAPTRRSGSGVGLIGLRERVELLSGSLVAGPRPDGGYRLAVAVPIEGS